MTPGTLGLRHRIGGWPAANDGDRSGIRNTPCAATTKGANKTLQRVDLPFELEIALADHGSTPVRRPPRYFEVP